MKPLVERLEKEYEGKVEFRRYNVEEDPAGVKLANEVGAQYVPTFLFAGTDGVLAQQLVGEQSEKDLRAILDTLK